MGGNYGILRRAHRFGLDLYLRVGVDVTAFGTNVTNKKYYTYIPGLGGGGAEFAQVAEPRMYGVRLRYRFGH